MSSESDQRTNLLAINLSLVANLVLAVLKTAVGIFAHSQALLADGVNSTSDVVYLLIVRVFMRLAGKPPDREHPYGHHQLEGIAAVVIGAFVITTAVAIFWNAINQVFDLVTQPSTSEPVRAVALLVALLTVILKVVLTIYTGRVSRKTGSLAVLALSRDHRNDIFSITAAAVGIVFAQFGYVWVDPLAAAVVAMVILHTGVTIIRESSADLMLILPDKSVGDHIRGLIEAVAGVQQVEEIHVHCIGPYYLVDLTIGIDGSLSVAAGDQIASQVEETVWRNVEYIRRVSVHYHPSRPGAKKAERAGRHADEKP